MEFNVAQCNVMHFEPGTALYIVMSVNEEEHLLPVVQSVGDIGVSFSSNLVSRRIDWRRGREKSCS